MDGIHSWLAGYLAPDRGPEAAANDAAGGGTGFAATLDRWHAWASAILAPDTDEQSATASAPQPQPQPLQPQPQQPQQNTYIMPPPTFPPVGAPAAAPHTTPYTTPHATPLRPPQAPPQTLPQPPVTHLSPLNLEDSLQSVQLDDVPLPQSQLQPPFAPPGATGSGQDVVPM